ncbi:MAG: hypothetical protein A2W93_09135 [Bacteroidetes bacterium GWF2_43_63]|nr:MAG: hypothetical protein A2W94_05515 [Bacteroidetes bacterium GWE2_42_42]OFY54460.1 MAG: hypothetical protein A2W93_09135 [Bacteroidetes bacterium GWF2_43_63]HBG70408.1 pseudouridine synthase [Bacteroidales bacterium]HCB63475.1 pseudouridine synthase [Bacteroidales bacterium]
MEKRKDKNSREKSPKQHSSDRKTSRPVKRFSKDDKPAFSRDRNRTEKAESGAESDRKTSRPVKRFSKDDKPAFSRDRNRTEKAESGTGNEKPVLRKKTGRFSDDKPQKGRYSDNPRKPRPDAGSDRPARRFKPSENSTDENRRGNSRDISRKTTNRDGEFRPTKSFEKSYSSKKDVPSKKGGEDTRLNKFISNSGICSRREADVLISTGVVKVNGEVIITMGYKVKPGDKVTVDGRELKSEKKVYILLNKPKDTITTTDDPSGRATVMDIVKDACRERVYPVGRLDRNTTGLILLTNDGDMAKKLMHPSHKIIKVYEATLDKNITREDMDAISKGVTIEDDFIPIDGIAWPEPDKKNLVGIELHNGKYHVVKRIFEQLGYDVIKLDRTMYGPLTKKNLPRGTFRFLNDSEISILHRL